MALSVAKLAEYMSHGLNIYIVGEAGTGKTQCLKAAAKKKGYKMAYMSAPTLDAYVDLVGIPIAEQDEKLKKKVLEFVRKKEFEDIEGIFIDEFPRGELKTHNAFFEIIQDGTINGEKAFPKLKFVVAAGNPITDEYMGQQQLDLALLDRFDMYLETDIKADLAYFVTTFGKDIGKALVDWHNMHDHKEKGYLSPRRLEKIGHTWLKMPEISTLKAMMPPGGDFNVALLQKMLQTAAQGSKVRNDPTAPLLKRIPLMDNSEVRKSRDEILNLLPTLKPDEVARVTESVSRSLKEDIRVSSIVKDWGAALEYFSAADIKTLLSNWPPNRKTDLYKKLSEAQIAMGKNLVSI